MRLLLVTLLVLAAAPILVGTAQAEYLGELSANPI